MKADGIREMNIIGIDWRQSGLCACRLAGRQGIFRAVPLLAEGEYVHKRNGRPPEQFFCGKLEDFFANIQASPFSMPKRTGAEWDWKKGLLLLVSVPEPRLERHQALDFAARLEQAVGPLLQRMRQSTVPADAVAEDPGQVRVIVFPRIRAVWEHCRSRDPDNHGIGVVQILEETTQFLLRPGQEVTASFGGCLAGSEDGRSGQYYRKPVRYRENNYLYEPDRFLWQDASYASWYQAFYQICKKVFEAQGWGEECSYLALTGSEACLPCAKKALDDMEAAAGSECPVIANEIPVYLLQWFCRLHDLPWDEEAFAAGQGRKDGKFGEFSKSERPEQSWNSECFGQSAGDIWDI